MVLGTALVVCAALALSWRAQWARWLCAGIGALVMAVPILFSTGNAAAYLSDTLVGALIFGFAVCTKPEPGPSAIAALTGPLRRQTGATTHPTGRSAYPSSCSRSSASTSRATSPATSLATYRAYGIPFSPARPPIRKRHRRDHHLGDIKSMAGLRCGSRRLHLSAGNPDRHRRLADALANHALAGGAVRPDDRAARHHVDLLHHHPADRHRHLEHHCLDRRGGGADADSLFARRTARHPAVPAPSRKGRTELAARALRRRHRRNAEDARCRAACRRVRPARPAR